MLKTTANRIAAAPAHATFECHPSRIAYAPNSNPSGALAGFASTSNAAQTDHRTSLPAEVPFAQMLMLSVKSKIPNMNEAVSA
ncbi:MAG: hypothetical protein QOJ99_3187 [Bryobacterales bacterium]|nr:hypothetical protein [Bryobacterales bacterium]